LERPIVDEWLNILGQVIQKIWPEAELKKQKFSMKVSHDVDQPSLYGFKPWKTIIRMMAGHLLKRHDIKAFFQAPYIKITTNKKLHKKDPYNTFDRIMDISEKHNLISAFYFICGRTSEYDSDYKIEDPIIQELLQRIHSRGHEIGLHPSYGTFQTPELIKKEAERLRDACKMAGTEQKSYGGRMHYLRWEHPTTLQACEDAGMSYDTTLSYADRPGFRCGTCFEYPAFNPITQELLNIRIRPLIIMECTIIADRYMNLGYGEQSLNKFLELKDKCRQVNGCFTLLWHNSHFTNREDFEIYEKGYLFIREIKKENQ
jgi:peptidoglycan/xylan/chitin deacetylase (PgdA/CDA1 family)